MHKYCTDVLHLSEAEAHLRITAARAARRHPMLLSMLEDGRLHLSGVAVLAPHLTAENCEELLARATHKTKRELLVLVAEIAPKRDFPPSLRKVPNRQKKAAQSPQENVEPEKRAAKPKTATTPSGRSNPTEPGLASEAPEKPPVVEPLSPARYKVQFTASAEFHEKLQRLQALMPGTDLAAMLESAVTEKLERLEAKRLGKVKKPRKNLEEADTSPGARAISAPVRRFVWERDGGQCTFRASDGRRCPERGGLEFHHDEPHGRGGDRSPENIRLLCRQHNLYMEEKDYGRAKMDAFRGPSDEAREPSPLFLLFPDGVRDFVAPRWKSNHASPTSSETSVEPEQM